MKQKTIYLRGRRVASTPTTAFFKKLGDWGLIDFWSPMIHCPVTRTYQENEPVADEMCFKQKDKNFWNSAKKIVTVRNPYENTVSTFLHGKVEQQANAAYTLPKEFIESQAKLFKNKINIMHDLLTNPKHEKTFEKYWDSWYADMQWYIYADDKKVHADIILKYEDQRKSLTSACKELGVDLKYARADFGEPRQGVQDQIDKFCTGSDNLKIKYDYRDFYDDETRELVYKLRKREIDEHGYTF